MAYLGHAVISADFYLLKQDSKFVPWDLLRDDSISEKYAEFWEEDLSCVLTETQPLPNYDFEVTVGDVVRVTGSLRIEHIKYSTECGYEYDNDFYWEDAAKVEKITDTKLINKLLRDLECDM